jgi:uncharacterized protein (DUF779 family)
MTARITVTPRAADPARGLAAAHGPLGFHLSGGCCDGSSPMCLLASELPPGSLEGAEDLHFVTRTS